MYRIICVVFLAVTALSGCLGKVQEPEFIDVENIRLGGEGRLNTLSGDIRLFNPNKYNLALKSGNLDIYIEDRLLGKTALDTLLKIPKLDTFLIPIKINLQTNNLISNALSLALKDSLSVRLEGKVTVGRSGMFVTRQVWYETREKLDIFSNLW